ncbi:10417_t:CDS:2 [Paraglomus brasilianum]|uniref:10417_t:CDS:1 n=1 Tax=Paraglomus brasilianum TaxID=144538 RepID=A0A9N9EZT9_9GLOM|nr:10417_t:CDS:2 [Paraglomus brasilianum]
MSIRPYSQLSDFNKDEKKYDLLIIAGNEQDRKTFKAHISILSTRSIYFRAALSETWLRRKEQYYVFEKPNVAPELFKVILGYLYTRNVNIDGWSEIAILKLLIASDELLLEGLVEIIQNNFIKSKETFILMQPIQVLDLVFRLESCKKLTLLCLKMCAADARNIFLHNPQPLEEEMLISLLRRDDLLIEEVELWKYVIRWGLDKHPQVDRDPTKWSADNVNQIKTSINVMINLIRFFSMSPNEYREEVRQYWRLLPKRLIKELQNHNVPLYNQKKKAESKSSPFLKRHNTVFVSWQGYPATDSELRKIFDGLDIKVIRPCPTQSSAYIDFNTMDSMIRALAKDGKNIAGYIRLRINASRLTFSSTFTIYK